MMRQQKTFLSAIVGKFAARRPKHNFLFNRQSTRHDESKIAVSQVVNNVNFS